MEFLKLLLPRLKSEPTVSAMEDITVYKVETLTNSYCGRISHQNDMVIWLRHSSGKPIKILKENITRITIL